MASRSARSDSSASSSLLKSPTSPVPSSVDALPRDSKKAFNKNAMASTAHVKQPLNGSATAVQQDKPDSQAPPSVKGRTRSSSFQKGAAVLRALARAPEDEVDSGYEDEGREGRLDAMPVPLNNGHAASDVGPASVRSNDSRERASSQEGLTQAAKQSGRENRNDIRRRRDDQHVARIVGGKPMGEAEIARREKRKTKSWEIPRKIFHSSIGFAVLYLYVSKTDLTIIVRNLGYFLGVVVTADVIRLNVPSFEWLYEKVLGFLMRESEREKVNGVVWYLVGVLFCLRLLPEDIACVSIMILSWADTAASVFGRLFGKYTPPLPSPPFAARKSLAGTLAASTVAALTATVFWLTPVAQIGKRRMLATEGLNPVPTWLLCIGSGIVGGVAEGLELGGVDDNLSVPILSAIGIKSIVWAWNYFFSA